ncbi:MAG: ABC transporter permease subunit [Dehalococcoidia bacterium]|nr:MAG: ABC transporter permease subunit [Dehalococcoidia bacterium]
MSIVFVVLGTLMLLFIFVPLIKTIFSSSPGTLWNTLLGEDVYSSILLTICAALMATLLGLLLGVPLAYLLARHQFRGKRFLEAIIDVPIVIPHSAAGVALLFVFGSNFLCGKVFHGIGIDFFRTFAGIVIAMMFVSVPFLIDSAKEGFKAVDVRLEKVARTLGASPWSAFFRISLPLAWRSIFAGSVLMWARGLSEFGAIVIIAYSASFFGWNTKVLPVLVADRFDFGLEYAGPVAALAILISLIAFIVLRTIAYRGEKA